LKVRKTYQPKFSNLFKLYKYMRGIKKLVHKIEVTSIFKPFWRGDQLKTHT